MRQDQEDALDILGWLKKHPGTHHVSVVADGTGKSEQRVSNAKRYMIDRDIAGFSSPARGRLRYQQPTATINKRLAPVLAWSARLAKEGREKWRREEITKTTHVSPCLCCGRGFKVGDTVLVSASPSRLRGKQYDYARVCFLSDKCEADEFLLKAGLVS